MVVRFLKSLRPLPPGATGLEVASVFTWHMVLQRGIPVVVWGRARPGTRVDVAFAGQKVRGITSSDGRWSVTLEPLEASAAGRTLMVTAGSDRIEIKDVVVGEVWLCSGQSNMGWTIKASDDAHEHARSASDSDVRFLVVPVVRADCPQGELPSCTWAKSHPEHAMNWSAVALHFATALHRALDVPIGIIWASLGATKIQEWTSSEINALHAYDIPEEWNGNCPSTLFNGMIAPLIPFTLRGAAWYQGEENHWGAGLYRMQQVAMIEDWRERWGQGSFPFVYVQLANFGKTHAHPWSAWAELQEAQLKGLSHPNTAMAVAIDLGEEDDIHPPRKHQVGRRLALAALGLAYGWKGSVSGPLFRSYQREGHRIRVFFDHAEGLRSTDGEALRWFEIADAAAGDPHAPHYVAADAVIEGETVVVSAPAVTEPIAVRYAFNANPVGCNLCNAASLPASPFRTSQDWSVTLGNDRRRPIGQAPVAAHQRIAVAPRGTVEIHLRATTERDAVPDFEIVECPAYGTLSGVPPLLVYRHQVASAQQDGFTFRVVHGGLASNVASVRLDIR